MALNLRQKQTSCIVRMLNLNQPPNSGAFGPAADTDEVYKILVLDSFCYDVLLPLISTMDLRRQGISVSLLTNNYRLPVPGVPAIYFIVPSPENIRRVAADVSLGLYDSFHLNLSSTLPPTLVLIFAAETLMADADHRVANIYFHDLEFVTLEDGLFSLAQGDAYVRLNDPSAGDWEIKAIVEGIVGGLFCVLATLGVVPIIRCARGGPAEMVASALDALLRDRLVTEGEDNSFWEVTDNPFGEAGGLASSLQRSVLCIFDRNFDLAVGIQHDWSYRPLVHDLLGLRLNRIRFPTENAGIETYKLDSSDPFWNTNSWSPFPKVAEEIAAQVRKYKQDADEVKRKAGGTGLAEFDATDLMGYAENLRNMVNLIPELAKRKEVIDKHTNITTTLLGKIKERSIDAYCNLEDDILTKGSVDRSQLLGLLTGKGTKADKLRLAITYLLSTETTPQSDLEAIEAALKEAQVDTCAFQYVKKIMSLNASLAPSASSASRSSNNIVDWASSAWAEKLYKQLISALTAGMKNFLSGERQPALTRTVEALMEGKPEVDSYLIFDPCAPKSGAGAQLKGPFNEAIVFMIGGGNYVEYRSLMELAQHSQPTKHVVYGATEILNGAEFVDQLTVLGQKMGLGTSGSFVQNRNETSKIKQFLFAPNPKPVNFAESSHFKPIRLKQD